MKRKIKRPCFVKVKLHRDGIVEAVDDEGEIFQLQMMRGEAWPIVSRRVRRFELEDSSKRRQKTEPPPASPPPPAPFTPKLVG
jgi:hypothetical protein